MDRLGRSLQHLVGFLGELHAKDVGLYLHQQGLDTTTPAGRALFQMCGVFAEFERAIMVECTKAGLARARSNGRRLGRPRVVTEDAVGCIRAARDRGLSLCAVARETGLSVGSVRRALAGCARPVPGPITSADTSGSFVPPRVHLHDGTSALVVEPRSEWLTTRVYFEDGGVARVERRGGFLPHRVVVEGRVAARSH